MRHFLKSRIVTQQLSQGSTGKTTIAMGLTGDWKMKAWEAMTLRGCADLVLWLTNYSDEGDTQRGGAVVISSQ